MNSRKKLYPERVLEKIGRDVLVPGTWHKIIFGDSGEMGEVEDNSIHLVITSPPYPMIKIWDKFFESVGCFSYEEMHEYLAKTWREVYRVLVEGGIACINIGDATRTIDGRYRLYPNHSRVIEQCEALGFASLPNILWMKPTTKPNAFLGSGFLPPNAYVTLDCEYILIFRKGDPRKFPSKSPRRYASYFTKEDRNTWFSQLWNIAGVKQDKVAFQRRIAAFPEEIAYRLIRMFSIIGDVVLDPFLGTGTTTKVAMRTHRNSIGYEVDENLLKLIKEKVGEISGEEDLKTDIEFIRRGVHRPRGGEGGFDI